MPLQTPSLFLCLALLFTANSASMLLNDRQVLEPSQLPTATSYDYWWPYPPGGIATTPTSLSTPTSTLIASTMPLSTMDTDDMLPSEVLTAPLSSSLSSDSITSSADDSSTVSANSTNSSSVLSSSTSSSTSSLPASSPAASSSQPKPSQLSSKTMMYLTPVFVIFGVVLGSICAWIGWGCFTRKPRVRDMSYLDPEAGPYRSKRKNELEGGPVYSAPDPNEKPYYCEDDDDLLKAKRTAGYTEVEFSWPPCDDQASKRDYLVPPIRTRPQSRSTSISRSVAKGRQSVRCSEQDRLLRSTTSKTSKTDYSVSVYSQGGDEADNTSFMDEYESDDGTIDNCRQPGITSRRGRSTHRRMDSDLQTLNEDPEEKNSRSGATTPGFRIIEESPLPTPAVSSLATSPVADYGWNLFWAQARGGQVGDNRTPQASRTRGMSYSSSHPVLPQSPPTISTPILESSLCFSPVLGQEASRRDFGKIKE